MADHDHAELRRLFDLAIATPIGERDAVLVRECAGQPGLKDRVLAMVRAAEDEQFLSSPTADVAVDDRLESSDDQTIRRESRKDSLAASGGSDFQHGRFEPGQRLGTRYRIVGLLGQGGMGQVYRADDLELGQSVALKFLPERVAADESWLRRFRNEVRTARQVAHPNVCRIYDIAEHDGHVFLSMEYVDGEDLSSVLRRLGRPSREKAIEIARQICLGLAAAHESNVLHRDLKPANIMIDGRGRVRITDFGLAGFLDELEQVEARAGTPAYMAPEQLAHGKVSVRSDVYALGLILYELFTGACVFETNDIEELKREHASGAVSRPSSVSEEIDPVVERVIMRCLDEEPEERPQSVYQVLAALPGSDPLAAALAAGETPSPEMIASARGRGGLRPAVALSLLALCVAAVVLQAVLSDTNVAMPVKGPDVLAVEAVQAMARLGHTDLPANSAAGYETIYPHLQSGDSAGPTVTIVDWPPKYRYWRRWASGSLLPANFHQPYRVQPDDPPMSRPGDARVALDSTGRLLELEVIPDSDAEPLGETDWDSVLDLLGNVASDAQPTAPVRPPKRAVDELRAWKLAQLPEVVVQAGAVGGRIVSFGMVGANIEASSLPGSSGEQHPVLIVVLIVANVVMVVLAIRNIRRRRSDVHGAIRFAVLMAAFELAIEVLSIRIHERSALEHLIEFFNGQAAGHVAMHGIKIFIAYLAIEPYVRRLWPRLLVGAVRLVSGRATDPLVGREILIGSVVGLWLPFALFLVMGATLETPGDITDRLGPIPVALLAGVSGQAISHLVALAWSLVFALGYATLLVFARIVVRRNDLALVVASVVISAQFFQFFRFLEQMGTRGLIVAIAIGLLAGAVIGATGRWSGLLSVCFAFAMSLSAMSLTFSFRLAEWYGGHALMSAAFVLTFPAIGCWLSLAGQPIFKDTLAEPPFGR